MYNDKWKYVYPHSLFHTIKLTNLTQAIGRQYHFFSFWVKFKINSCTHSANNVLCSFEDEQILGEKKHLEIYFNNVLSEKEFSNV